MISLKVDKDSSSFGVIREEMGQNKKKSLKNPSSFE